MLAARITCTPAASARVKASPRENGYVESVNGKLRDELPNGEVFTTLRRAQVLIEGWRRHDNRVCAPTPETVPMARSQSS